jgi:hypothetical protein
MRQVAKAFAAVAGEMTGVPGGGSVWLTVLDADQAAQLHAALAATSERVHFGGPYESSGRVGIEHEFGSDWRAVPRLVVTLSVPPAVADEIAPTWRTASAGDQTPAGAFPTRGQPARHDGVHGKRPVGEVVR